MELARILNSGGDKFRLIFGNNFFHFKRFVDDCESYDLNIQQNRKNYFHFMKLS